jgi:hypothetical protein
LIEEVFISQPTMHVTNQTQPHRKVCTFWNFVAPTVFVFMASNFPSIFNFPTFGAQTLKKKTQIYKNGKLKPFSYTYTQRECMPLHIYFFHFIECMMAKKYHDKKFLLLKQYKNVLILFVFNYLSFFHDLFTFCVAFYFSHEKSGICSWNLQLENYFGNTIS